MNCIEIKNLIVEYNGKKAIDDISLSIKEGEFVCILGRNGSGKSTLAKTINGLIQGTSGDVIVYGMNTKDNDKIIEIRKNVGISFQNPDNQIVSSIVEEDVAFGLENIGIETSLIRERIDEAMKNIGIYELKDSLTSTLSGGQKQKVSIAGILAMKSKILILDEPTSMIDSEGRRALLYTLKRLNEEGLTIILITHYVEEISCGNRVLVIDEGKIKLDDTPENILLNKEVLDDIGIDLPYVTSIARKLRDCGKNVKGNEDSVEKLCKYLK